MNFQLTLTSVFSVIVFGLCIALFLEIVLRNYHLLSKVKYELLLVCLAIPVLKILVPVEVIPWTHNIDIAYVLPEIVIFMNRKVPVTDGVEITIWSLVLVVLLIGSIVNAIRWVCSFIELQRCVNMLPKVEDAKICKLVDEILLEKGKSCSIDLRWCSEDGVAQMGGFRKLFILLPKKETSQVELESVLRHEIAHCLHGDMWIRLGWIIIKIICWWNPAVYILDKQFQQLLEIRADENAMKGLNLEKSSSYMETIISVSRSQNKAEENREFCASFKEKDGLSSKIRVQLILNREKRKNWSYIAGNLVAMTGIVALTVTMNVFIFEPKGKVPEVENYQGSEMMSKNDGFLIKNEDGTFDMYYKGQYCSTLTSNPGADFPIYESIEEAREYEEIR